VLDGFGYSIVENRREDGTVRGRLQQGGSIRAIDVVIFETGAARTISITEGRISGGGDFKGRTTWFERTSARSNIPARL
jgi:hypothetical protein